MNWQHQLADALLVSIGYQQYIRMNEPRMRRHVGRDEFLMDIYQRIGGGPANNVRCYLMQRLVPSRLALPDGYDPEASQ